MTTSDAARPGDRADLHTHTVHSDGAYTPEQVVDLARRGGLAAVAVTDHDTVAGVAPAQAAAGNALEVVPALEVTARHRLLTLHILGYFVRPDHAALRAALDRLRAQRVRRFRALVGRLRGHGLSVDEGEVERHLTQTMPGRRHLADLLVRTRQAASVQDAFRLYLGEAGRLDVPRAGLPAGEAIATIRAAGGVAVWAHPAYDCRRSTLIELQSLGLGGLEAEYPGYRPNQVRQLRRLAAELGLLVTGGSDCHGPRPWHQTIGSRTTSAAELDKLRQAAK